MEQKKKAHFLERTGLSAEFSPMQEKFDNGCLLIAWICGAIASVGMLIFMVILATGGLR